MILALYGKPPKQITTAEELLSFLVAYGLHIGDGVDDCAGHADDELKEASEVLWGLLTAQRTTPAA